MTKPTLTQTLSARLQESVPATGLASASQVQSRNWLAWTAGAALLLSVVALSISGYLSWVAFTSSKVAGCGSGGTFNCEHVLTSKWSKALGVPVAFWAACMYASVVAILATNWRRVVTRTVEDRATWPWALTTAAAVSAGGAALWFIGLQVFVIEHLCPWCLGAHACGLVLCGLMLAGAPLGWANKFQCFAVGVIGAVGLMTVQLAAPEPEAFEIVPGPSATTPDGTTTPEVISPEVFDAPSESGIEVFEAPDAAAQPSLLEQLDAVRAVAAALFNPQTMFISQVAAQQEPNQNAASQEAGAKDSAEKKIEEPKPEGPQPRLVQLASPSLVLNAWQWPTIGDPAAKYIFVEMFDYTCPHCKNSQVAIKGAMKNFGADLAIVALPVPLHPACNRTVTSGSANHRDACEIAKIAIAVWRADRNQFAEFHDWLFQQPTPLSASTARAEAERRIGADKLRAELEAPQVAKYIQKHVDLYDRVGRGPVPKMLFPKQSIVGEITSAQRLIQEIQTKGMQ